MSDVLVMLVMFYDFFRGKIWKYGQYFVSYQKKV